MSAELELQEMNERVTQLIYDVAELNVNLVLDGNYDSDYVEVVEDLNEFVLSLGRWVCRIPAPFSNPPVDAELPAELPESIKSSVLTERLTTVQSMLMAAVDAGRPLSEISRETGIARASLSRIAEGETKKPHTKTLRALEEFWNMKEGDLNDE